MEPIIRFYKSNSIVIILLLFSFNLYSQKTVRYDLYVKDTLVNFAGKEKRAIAVNGQIPMPTLTFTEGDTAEIHVHNLLKEETSLHWHGLFYQIRKMEFPILHKCPFGLIQLISIVFQLSKMAHIGTIRIQDYRNK